MSYRTEQQRELDRQLDRAVYKGASYPTDNRLVLTFELHGEAIELEVVAVLSGEDPALDVVARRRR